MSGARYALVAAVLAACLGADRDAAGAATLKTLYSFCATDCSDGETPLAGLLRDPSGTFYGVAIDGGPERKGSVYAMVPSRGQKLKFMQLYAFCPGGDCTTGRYPTTKPIVDAAGNVYGTTNGYSDDTGTVYELIPNRGKTKWKIKVLYHFCPGGTGSGCPDGAFPSSALTYAGKASGLPYDGTSPLFGTASWGGHGQGTVFELVPDGHGGWTQSVVYSFCAAIPCPDGAVPLGDLTLDADGNIFGTTEEGGSAISGGTVFELTGAARGRAVSETVLYNFCSQPNCADGQLPAAGVTFDGAGNLFGVVQAGGANFGGAVYKLVPAGTSSSYQLLYSFCVTGKRCDDGAVPTGQLTIDASGNLYGTTVFGGGKKKGGTVYELVAGGGGSYQLSTLYVFCSAKKCKDGYSPDGGVTMDAMGNLFGVTEKSPTDPLGDGGTVFEFTP